MSDFEFTSSFWPLFISVITVLGILGCAILLWVTNKTKVQPTEDMSTGHVWDGDLREMNNPLPRWWVWMFIITIVFSVAYLIIYPGMGSYQGKLGWTQVGQFEAEMAKAEEVTKPLYDKFTAMSVEEVAADEQAMAIGGRLFLNNCAQCHGSDAGGSKGFPNLTDNDWLHGGEPETIKATLTNGRVGMMPPMASMVGSEDDVKNVANYVLSLSNSQHDAARAELGKEKFMVCAACHGPEGKGNQMMGAPNLTDGIWLHGAGEKNIIAMINNGKMNQMPAQADKLSEAQIHVLTAYVWGLSNK
ncbi:MAG: cytochrome-c oxidase, cbb3-type subunit III [Betaproteobacteria bacterium HGW-Betaproteobacteria-2]|jgi:cytochrome c oxidase cbb3-type subunit 3|nr:MAG: cytochrome-c oxidase, cbb3-type subunit III [Betaproteobacteria bacterium HGW-Betaproteobacteria-2]PKO92200.1 MAG: cytochrome-c oxidase, cbb3-type subunit III [Betaproteobacteria bacterium HGW-Betaproteobacteria-1]